MGPLLLASEEIMNPLVYIVILNWNGKEDTLECLASIVQLDYPNYEARNNVSDPIPVIGLNLYATICDSLELEFYGSEQYLQDITLSAKNSYWLNHDNHVFTHKEIEGFRNRARQVNEKDECGRACFFFRAA